MSIENTIAVVKAKVGAMQEWAAALVVADAEQYESAVIGRRGIVALKAWVSSQVSPYVDAAHKAHKEMCGLRDAQLKPLEDAARAVGEKCVVWEQQQQRRAALEREIAEAEALKVAEEERLLEAIALEAKGKSMQADMALALPVKVEPVKVEPAVPQFSGTSYRISWRCEIINATAVPREFCCPDEGKLRKYADAMKASAAVPGVRFYSDRTMIQRTA